jgi:hypothetical protein
VPKAQIFQFENYWTNFEGFLDTVNLHWHSTPFFANSVKTLSGKFKQVRRGLKAWSHNLSNLNKNIHNISWVLALLDGLEDARPLCRLEKKFRQIVKKHLAKLLETQICSIWG